MCVNRKWERLRERQNGMKQRIRGLVSLHEIPFPLAPYKGKKAIVHIIQTAEERETWGKGGEMGRIAKISRNTLLLFMFPPCCSAWLPPNLWHHIHTVSCFTYFSLSFLVWQRGWEGSEQREERVTLALKPAIVFPPGHPANQAAQSERERVEDREREEGSARERERRLPWLLPGRCEHTCLSVGRGSVHSGPSHWADVHVCVFVCTWVFISMCVWGGGCWCGCVRVAERARANTPGLINWTFHGSLCKQTCTNTHIHLLNRTPAYRLTVIEPIEVDW